MQRYILLSAVLIGSAWATLHVISNTRGIAREVAAKPSLRLTYALSRFGGGAAPLPGGAGNNRLFIVPAGVHNAEEFRTRPDPVARRFYAGIVPESLVAVHKTGAFYLSYRRGDAVYWTRAAHQLRAEPALFVRTGGALIRERCGNLLSSAPQQPTEAEDLQPTETELGAPIPPPAPTLEAFSAPPKFAYTVEPAAFPLPGFDSDWSQVPGEPVHTGAGPDDTQQQQTGEPKAQWFLPGAASGFFPLLGGGFAYPASQRGSGTPSGPPPSAIPNNPTALIPEPSSCCLILCGLALCAGGIARRSKT